MRVLVKINVQNKLFCFVLECLTYSTAVLSDIHFNKQDNKVQVTLSTMLRHQQNDTTLVYKAPLENKVVTLQVLI